MRKGLTLIELILSMVIIGVVFTVIPRLVMSMNQNTQTTIKEEVMFNALTYLGKIIYLPWDQNNTTNDKILITEGNETYNCNGIYRDSNFTGSRQCDELQTASSIGKDGSSDDFNDIDDYDENTTTPTIDCNGTPKTISKNSHDNIISANVIYANDPILSNAFELNASDSLSPTSNTKYISVQIGGCTVLHYHSFNIGRVGFDYRDWE